MQKRKRETTTANDTLHLLQCFGKQGLAFFLFRFHDLLILGADQEKPWPKSAFFLP